MRTFVRCLAVPMFIGAFLCLTASFAQAAFPGKNGKIAITGIWTLNPEAGLPVNPDGSNATLPLVGGVDPAWSSDGKSIAFTKYVDLRYYGDADIYSMDQNGLNLRQITSGPGLDRTPTWSPDGERIAFSRATTLRFSCLGHVRCMPATGDIYVARVDGTELTNLTRTPSTGEVDFEPAWSPDGRKIAFVSGSGYGEPGSNQPGKNNIFVMNADGSDRVQLTNNVDPEGFQYPSSFPGNPNWSPDGEKIAYDTFPIGADSDPYDSFIRVMNADGSGDVQVHDEDRFDITDPAWSPDGRYIAFTKRTFGLFLTDATPIRDEYPVPGTYGHGFTPDWQPIPPPRRDDYARAAQFCKALRAFLGNVTFTQRYKNHGRCVSESR